MWNFLILFFNKLKIVFECHFHVLVSAFGAAVGLIGAGVIKKAIATYASNYIEADLQEDAGLFEDFNESTTFSIKWFITLYVKWI